MFFQKENYSNAIRFYKEALKTFKAMGVKENSILSLNRIANSYRKSYDFKNAFHYLNKSIEIANIIESNVALANTKYISGLIYADNGDLEKSYNAFFEAIEYAEKIREKNLTNENILIEYFATVQDIYDAMIINLYNQKKYDLAFEYSEKSKARALKDFLRTASYNDKDSLFYLNHAVSRQNIQNAIDKNIQILDYKVTSEKTLLFFLNKNNFEVIEIPISKDELRLSVKSYREIIGADNFKEFKSRVKNNPQKVFEKTLIKAKSLYSLLLKPIENSLSGESEIYIIPDDILYRLPFIAMVNDSDNFLVNDYSLNFSPNVSLLFHNMKANINLTDITKMKLFAIGNPTKDIPQSEKEVNSISNFFTVSKKLLCDEVSKKEVYTAFRNGYDVYHFATHAVINLKQPRYSYLNLGNDIKHEIDNYTSQIDSNSNGLLQAFEIDQFDLSNTKLVFLSACRTGSGKFYRGEGVIGLSYAFLKSGASSIISTLWEIDDRYSAGITEEFYKNWINNGFSKSRALKEAQKSLINQEKNNGNLPHPYTWAAFSLTGSYN